MAVSSTTVAEHRYEDTIKPCPGVSNTGNAMPRLMLSSIEESSIPLQKGHNESRGSIRTNRGGECTDIVSLSETEE